MAVRKVKFAMGICLAACVLTGNGCMSATEITRANEHLPVLTKQEAIQILTSAYSDRGTNPWPNMLSDNYGLGISRQIDIDETGIDWEGAVIDANGYNAQGKEEETAVIEGTTIEVIRPFIYHIPYRRVVQYHFAPFRTDFADIVRLQSLEGSHAPVVNPITFRLWNKDDHWVYGFWLPHEDRDRIASALLTLCSNVK